MLIDRIGRQKHAVQAEFLRQPVQRPARDAQHLRCSALVPFLLLQDFDDASFFNRGQGSGIGERRRD